MRHRGFGVALASLLALALGSACDPPQPLQSSEVCTAYCDCAAPGDPAHGQCVADCEMVFGNAPAPSSCLACLDEPLCTLRDQCVVQCLSSPGVP